MLIDQLPEITTANDADELPIEQGTTTRKIKFLNLLKGVVKKAGDTMSGNLIVQNSTISEKSTTADTTDDAPSTTVYWDTKHTDKNDRIAAYWETSYSTSGTSETTFRARRNVNGSNVNNGFKLSVNKNGERFVLFDNPAVWRTALGLDRLNAQQHSGANGATFDIPLASSATGFIVTTGAASVARELVWFNCTSTGSVSITRMRNASQNVTFTAGTNKITVTNNSGAYIYCMKFWF